MKYLVTGKEMRLLDKNTSNYFKVPEVVLMEQASMCFVWRLCDILKEKIEKKNIRGIVFCGWGNNGADGIAIARLLNQKGVFTEVCKINDVVKEKVATSKSFELQEEIYHAYHFPIQKNVECIRSQDYDFVIDAIFGIGLSRDIIGEAAGFINLINEVKGIKFAVDMPSGVNSDNGHIMGVAVKCDYTITFSYAKVGQYLWPGFDYAGKIFVEQIGITDDSWLENKPSLAYLEKEDLSLLPRRPMHSNKGTFGKLLVIAGSSDIAGAAILTVKSAYRCGVGLVKLLTHENNRLAVQKAIPEVLLSTYKESICKESLINDMKWADAIVIGPGLGQSELAHELVEIVRISVKRPVVWDADALNVLSSNTELLFSSNADYVITPHLKEFSRLINNDSIHWIQNHLIEAANDFAKNHNLICVLKDFHTVTSNSQGISFLNLSGNNGMATGGSGDVLTGIIGALLAQGLSSMEASSFGVYIHGLAGDFAREKMGVHSIMASDIIEGLESVWKGIDDAKHESLCRD